MLSLRNAWILCSSQSLIERKPWRKIDYRLSQRVKCTRCGIPRPSARERISLDPGLVLTASGGSMSFNIPLESRGGCSVSADTTLPNCVISRGDFDKGPSTFRTRELTIVFGAAGRAIAFGDSLFSELPPDLSGFRVAGGGFTGSRNSSISANPIKPAKRKAGQKANPTKMHKTQAPTRRGTFSTITGSSRLFSICSIRLLFVEQGQGDARVRKSKYP